MTKKKPIDRGVRSKLEIPSGTFIGPDEETVIPYRHNLDTCECKTCETIRWQRIEKREQK